MASEVIVPMHLQEGQVLEAVECGNITIEFDEPWRCPAAGYWLLDMKTLRMKAYDIEQPT
jgi:hypothetical protein